MYFTTRAQGVQPMTSTFRVFQHAGSRILAGSALALALGAAHAGPATQVASIPAPALKPSTSIAAAPAQAAATANYDVRATGTAQLLAGVQPTPGDPLIDHLASTEAWKIHAKKIQQDWVKVQERLGEMEKWRDRELVVRDAPGRTLLYPFSGPDYLNAATLFPTHKKYVFFSLESPGKLPDLAKLNDQQFARLLEHTRTAMRDIFQRNYFITDYMAKQLGTDVFKGTVPVIATMMALEGKRIVRIENVDLFPELSKQYADTQGNRPGKRLAGVRIDFTDAKTGLAQQLTYYSLDATDKALVYYPGFLDAIAQSAKPATGFIKSASYLLHDQQFRRTRDMMLATADTVVQDDTGIPYRYFSRPSWQVTLYGQYAKPIQPLSYGAQPDLRAAYESQDKPRPISFPFGYHWKDGRSGLMIATRGQ